MKNEKVKSTSALTIKSKFRLISKLSIAVKLYLELGL